MKKKVDDEKDEERIHQQLKQINEEAQREKEAKEQLTHQEQQSKEDPRDFRRISMKKVTDNFVAPDRIIERKKTTRQISDLELGDKQMSLHNYRSNAHIDNLNLREERDF